MRSVSYPPEYWSDFYVHLVRLYDGRPMAPEGIFSGPLFVVWHIREGSVVVKNKNQTTRASAGEWMICLPGTHYQCFSKSAHLISMQFIIGCTHTPILWRGPEALRLPPDTRLDRLTRKLRRTQIEIGLPDHHSVGADGPRLPLPRQLEWQAVVLDLFQALLDRLARSGLWLEAWRGHDLHTRRSLAWFSGRSLSEPFSRQVLAQACDISSSQLDRIWRNELGITPRQYWDRLRMKQACEWLRDGRRSIKEIAAALGFEHASHFSTWFRQTCKRSPRSYQKSPTAS